MKLNISYKNITHVLYLAKQELSFQTTSKFHTERYLALFTMIAMISVLLSIGRTSANAIDADTSSSTLVVRENYPTDRPIYSNTGEAVDMNGTITNLTNSWLNVELSLRSNSSSSQSSDKGWVLLDVQPGKNFTITPHNPIIAYQFKVQFLKEGSYHLRPWARVIGSLNGTLAHGPIDVNSPACPRCAGLGTTVVVSEKGSENGSNNNADKGSFGPSILSYAAVAAIAIGGAMVVAIYISKARKSRQSHNDNNNLPGREH
jgi:hypothetical protein